MPQDPGYADLKLQNLMTIRGDARILDFGVAGLLDPNGERFTRSSDAVAGDAFSAPELTENSMLIDPRCDIYSLGTCWYWLFTGLSPKGVNWESRLRASVKISQPYERVLLRCLDQADKRYSSAAELLADIRALRQGNVPSHAPHDLTDDQARVLRIVVANCAPSTESTALYAIEQEIGKRQTRLRTSLAIRTLVTRGMIKEQMESDNFGNDYAVYRPLDPGIVWAERHVARIEDLLAPVEISVDTDVQGDSDGIPF